MASPRRPRHGHHISTVSDYESDGQYLSDMAAPPPAPRTNEELNMRVLKRYRPDTISLEYVVPYVVVYTFSSETLGWEKSGMEGSTFLCALTPSYEQGYRCAVVVLNRRGLENLNIELTSSECVDITEEYVIIKHDTAGQTNIYGLWVFREPPPSSTSHHPEAFAAKVQECLALVDESKRKTHQAQDNGGKEAEDGVPMGRQISLRELFGKQREEDDTWSVRSHSPTRHSSISNQITASIMEHTQVPNSNHSVPAIDAGLFATGATRTSRSVSPMAPQQSQQQSQPNGQQQQTLLDLFKKAGEQRGI